MPGVIALGMGALQPFHPAVQIGLWRLRRQVVVVPEQHPGLKLPTGAAAGPGQVGHPHFPVCVFAADLLPLVAPGHNVIEGPCILDPQCSWHATSLRSCKPVVKSPICVLKDWRPLDRLAEDSFDVYYYDQVGCGNSARLSDPREYSIRRHVQDLEAIRQALGAERIVLVGLSWGSTLAAQYCAAYPNRVAKVVFESPGHLWSGPYPNDSDAKEGLLNPPQDRQQRIARLMRNPRIVFGSLLFRVNPQLTSRVAPEPELARFLGLLFGEIGNENAVCDPLRLPARPPLGLGAYAFMRVYNEYQRMSDPRAALSTNAVPALVIRGACEWLKPQVAQDYVQAFPNSTFTEIEKGGHLLFLEQPEAYLRTIRGFLLDKR